MYFCDYIYISCSSLCVNWFFLGLIWAYIVLSCFYLIDERFPYDCPKTRDCNFSFSFSFVLSALL
jgi:hypothetical protein